MCIQSQISADDLFGFLFATENGGEHMAMIYSAYIDDSADSKRERVIIASAIIGDKIRWGIFEELWRERLDRDGIEYFKSSHCENLNGQFHKFRDFGIEEGKRRAALIRDDLDKIVHDCNLVVISVTQSRLSKFRQGVKWRFCSSSA